MDQEKGAVGSSEFSRRKFVRTAAYVAPVILTLIAVPTFASAGSAPPGKAKVKAKAKAKDKSK
jgi:hypothetical protein